MSPVGWRGEHLSSGRCCLAAGRSAGHWFPSVGRWGGGTPGPVLLARHPAWLARRPGPAQHMVSLFSFFPGNRDGGGRNRVSLFLSERLAARRKVQK